MNEAIIYYLTRLSAVNALFQILTFFAFCYLVIATIVWFICTVEGEDMDNPIIGAVRRWVKLAIVLAIIGFVGATLIPNSSDVKLILAGKALQANPTLTIKIAN